MIIYELRLLQIHYILSGTLLEGEDYIDDWQKYIKARFEYFKLEFPIVFKKITNVKLETG